MVLRKAHGLLMRYGLPVLALGAGLALAGPVVGLSLPAAALAIAGGVGVVWGAHELLRRR